VVVVGEDAKTSPCDKSSDNHASKLTIDAEVSFDVITIMGCAASRLSSLVTSVAKLAVVGKRGVLVASLVTSIAKLIVVGKRGVLVASLVTSVAKLIVVGRREAFVASMFAARATKVPNVLE
jgi:hypothetical protein